MSAYDRRAARICHFVADRGNDPRDVRDAAHEAVHAIEAGAKDWEREEIHARLVEKYGRRGELAAAEIRARCVEMLVCKALRIPYDVSNWAMWACLEAMKGGVLMPDHQRTVDLIVSNAKRPLARSMAARVLRLGSSSEAHP